jgi:tripartite-type tricarboxylate transporter receptor subunit TctC
MMLYIQTARVIETLRTVKTSVRLRLGCLWIVVAQAWCYIGRLHRSIDISLRFLGMEDRMFRARSIIVGLFCLTLAVVSVVASAGAQSFPPGKALTLVVGNAAGSGYDTYGRLVTRYMTKHLPGHPNIVVQHMPGAGSVKAAEYLYSIAPKDGTVFGLIMPGALVDPLATDPKKYRYEANKFEFIGTADSGTRVCFASARSGVKTLEDAQKKKVSVSSTPRADFTHMLNALAKTQFQIVSGYPGPTDILLALERGEGDAICGLDFTAVNSIRPGLLGSDKVNIMVQIGLEPKPFLTSLGVPEVWNYIPAEDRPVVELMVVEQALQRPFLAPPGTPADRMSALRAAFDATLKEPELLDQAKKSNLEINPKSGAQIAALILGMYSAPKELIERMGKVSRPQ